jgi:hypothetical protein
MSVSNSPIEFVNVEKLLLDEENPRLPEDLQPRSQSNMLQYIASKGSIEDLMSAIGKNGFFLGEALVVYRNPRDRPGFLRVIEGNRRLTAVKLILDPTQYLQRPSISELSAQAQNKQALTTLPVIRYPSRDEVLPYLGSRHIVGVRQWDPLAKARYMRQMFTSVQAKKKRSAKDGYRAVAAQIGSYKRSDYIKSNLDGLAVYDVMEAKNFFGIPGLSEETVNFGTLYTALGYDPIAEYVGIARLDPKTKAYAKLDPILDPSVVKVERVKRLAQWIYNANDDGETILGESRNLLKLAKVLSVPDARKQLESGATLDIAYGYTGGLNDDLMSHMQDARKQLRAANGISGSSNPDRSHLEAAGDLLAQAESLDATLRRRAVKKPGR